MAMPRLKMAEMDKFKRRIIRSIARMLIKEKKAEDEVWSKLKTETGCDCHQLWKRMRALTLKKVNCLLQGEDRLQNIPSVAQMSLTDWLLFDLVLVHEDIDVIGQNFNTKMDLRPMIDLFSIVQKLEIEGKSGDALADAWTAATFIYNGRGRQCSPMLLQRRWYQLKKLTRATFYDFWFTYRGNSRLLDTAKTKHMPDNLQMAVAKRYPHIVTKPFVEWNEGIEKKLVIMPEEFEAKIRASNAETVKIPDNEPDIVLVEPNIDTIEIGDEDSDSEKVQDQNETQPSASDTNDAETTLLNVNIKMEPADEIDIEEEKITTSIAEQLLKRDEQLLETVERIEHEGNNNVDGGQTTDGVEINDDEDLTIENEDGVSSNKDVIEKGADSDVVINDIEGAIEEDTEIDIPVLVKTNCQIHDKESDNCTSNDAKEIEAPNLMPQITSVFGNVNVSTDVLAEISSMSKKKQIQKAEVVPKAEKEEKANTQHEIPIDVEQAIKEKLDAFLGEHNKNNENTKSNDALNSIEQEKADVANESNVNNPFLGVPVDLTFVDDGIELVDDDDEDIGNGNKESTTVEVKTEPAEDKPMEESENPKFDLKLLMQPVVYTTKLDDMMIFKNEKVYCIRDAGLVNNILVESKPTSAKTLDYSKIKLEHDTDKKLSENIETGEIAEDASDNESSECEEEIDEESKVKLSSYLLQKPRSRSYNPIQLCKNPDFNTRLKRLTAGFLSFTRNRSLLKTLKPMTIDVSKAFETKLVNGTMYLKPSDNNFVIKKEKDINEQSTTVLPSAMPVQSLIDNLKMNILDILSQPTNITSKDNDKLNYDVFPERNKVINLPDIDHIRRMNQRLFTAEITPMRVQSGGERCMPPVQLVPSTNDDKTLSTSNISTVTTSISNVVNVVNSCQTNKPKSLSLTENLPESDSSLVIESTNITNRNLESVRPPLPKPKEPTKYRNCFPKFKKSTYNYIPPYRAKPVLTGATWLTKPPVVDSIRFEDSLITLDTLNKMLNVINDDNAVIGHKKKKKKKTTASEVFKQELELGMRIKQFENSLAQCNENEPQNKDVECTEDNSKDDKEDKKDKEDKEPKTKDTEEKSAKIPVPKVNVINTSKALKVYSKACCWARKKLDNPDKKSRHMCPHICRCCCRSELVAKTRRTEPLPQTLKQPAPKKIEVSIQCDLNTEKDTESSTDKPDSMTGPAESATIPLENSEVIIVDDSEISPEASLNVNTSTSNVIPTFTKPSFKIKPRERQNNLLITNRIQIRQNLEQGTKIMNNVDELKSYYSKKYKSGNFNNELVTVVNKESAKLKEKILYLNPQQKILDKTGCPIFLGKNKILMTDGKLPDFLNIKKTILNPVPPQNTALSTAIPHGVQLVLLPNGQVSYTVDPTIEVSAEQLAFMPSIVETVQQQLSYSIQKPPPNQNHEVVNLIDDDTASNISESNPNITQENEVFNIENPESTTERQYDNVTNIGQSEIVSAVDSNASALTITETTPRIQEPDATNDNENKCSSDTSDALASNNENITSEGGDNIADSDKVYFSDPEVSANEIVMTSEAASNEVTSQDLEGTAKAIDSILPKNSNRNSLLSDLMEISGISAEDTTPLPNEIPNMQPQIIPTIQTEHQNMTMNLQASTDATYFTSSCSSVPELTSITSFAHLKYASENNGKFFKMDLETGSVTPINVCIKKSEKPAVSASETKLMPSFIDLTDEQETLEIKVSSGRSLLKETYNVTNTAKPIRMFKSINILQRKSKASSALSVPPGVAATNIRRTYKRAAIPENIGTDVHGYKRKQSFGNVQPSIMETDNQEDSLDSDSLDEYIWKDDEVSCDDSDDEPLSIVAKRMRLNEVTTNSSIAESENKEKSIDKEAHSTEGTSIDLPSGDPDPADVNMELPDALCFMNQEHQESDDGEEDCILGV